MTLSKEIYRELEDIVGPENLSDDLAILDIYAFQRLSSRKGEKKRIRYFPRPETMVLPGSTKEVQAIIKLCNRRGIQCKASSTGYGSTNSCGGPGVVILDMRRMDRIVDIDAKNMIVIVEPYVTFAQVQAEVMKRGLGCHVVGAGSQVSMLASHTSVVGNNTQCISQGHSARNIFGAEWVTPTGEIVEIGAPGSGAGWFSGDGPGPSLRGIIRGAVGANGALGVFTKCAVHLHPWPGPAELEVKGVSPDYEAVIPPNFDYHVCEFPTWEQFADATYKIGEAGIAYAFHKTGGPGSHGLCITGSNDEYYEKKIKGELDVPKISFSLVLAAFSSNEFAYQEKVLKTILEETGGKICPLGEEPLWKKRDFLTMIKACFIPRLAFRATGTFDVDGILGIDSVDHCALGLKIDEEHRNKYAARGTIMDDGTLNSWGAPYEGSHLGLVECGHSFSSIDEVSIDGAGDMIREGIGICIKTPIALGWSFYGAEVVGQLCCNFQNWMKKIKIAFDPNVVCDTTYYISLDGK